MNLTVTAKTTRSLAVSYGVIHACVDLTSVTAVFRAARWLESGWVTPFVLVVGYDLLAFALQYPLGLVTDRLRLVRATIVGGLWLTLGAVFLVPVSPVLTMVAAGLGNALYHLGAGARVLRAAQGRAAPAGVFVAPGALGLGLGIWLGRDAFVPIWPLALLLAGCWAVAARLHEPQPVTDERQALATPLRAAVGPTVLGLLLLSVMIRSFVGLAATYQCPRTALLAWGLPLAGCLGKLLGGVVSDRLGWLETTVGALLLSAPFIAYGGDSAYLVLPSLLVFQATMPVTLMAVYRLFPARPAMSFGLPSLALIAGAFPTFFSAGQDWYGTANFLALVVLSAVAMLIALRMLGFRRHRRGPEPSMASVAD